MDGGLCMNGQWDRVSMWWTGLLCVVLLASACGKEEKDLPQIPEKPVVVGSAPSANAVDVQVGDQSIVLTYDRNVVLVSPHSITLNGKSVTQISAYLKEVTISVSLELGTDYRLHVPEGSVKGPTGGLSDAFSLIFSTRAAPVIIPSLVTPNASAEAQKVYTFLRDNYGEKIVSGTMSNVAWNTNEAQWVYRHTGKFPALNCFDYIHLYASPANWINYEDTRIAEEWWASNGLIAAGWHWNVPSDRNTNGYGFYGVGKNGGSGETAFDIKRAVTENTEEFAIVEADLEKIANNLVLLKQKNIPVIWRPLHEASGGWFWWGAGDAASYRKLWVMMFEKFKAKGLTNLIWVWTSQGGDMDWYPGDAYVDIIGCDLYNKDLAGIVSIHKSLEDDFPNKMITLSEFGNITDLTEQWKAGIKWSWAMPWYDYDRTVDPLSVAFEEESHMHAGIEYWRKLLANDYVLTRDKMPSLK